MEEAPSVKSFAHLVLTPVPKKHELGLTISNGNLSPDRCVGGRAARVGAVSSSVAMGSHAVGIAA